MIIIFIKHPRENAKVDGLKAVLVSLNLMIYRVSFDMYNITYKCFDFKVINSSMQNKTK